QQLYQNGMPESAKEVAGHLLEFGLTDPALARGFAELLLGVGLTQSGLALQDRLESPEARADLIRVAADQAVLHPDRTAASAPDRRRGALRVRAAREALRAGDEDRAQAELRDIARSPPFGDWKFFVRGLAGFYRHDAGEMHANWDRLDADRAAVRIAQA